MEINKNEIKKYYYDLFEKIKKINLKYRQLVSYNILNEIYDDESMLELKLGSFSYPIDCRLYVDFAYDSGKNLIVIYRAMFYNIGQYFNNDNNAVDFSIIANKMNEDSIFTCGYFDNFKTFVVYYSSYFDIDIPYKLIENITCGIIEQCNQIESFIHDHLS